MTSLAPPGSYTPPPPRWWDYVEEGRLFCPGHHHIPNTFDVTEAGFVRCHHWVDAERRECGLWVFIMSIRGGGIIVAAVSLDEKRRMKHLSTPAEMIRYLGIFTRGRPSSPSSSSPPASPSGSSTPPTRRR